MSRLECLGAAGEVTGSSYLLTGAKGGSVLIDCGIFQGSDEKNSQNHILPVDPKSLDAIILTHAHLDHSGRVPFYVKGGFAGNIFMTEPTGDLVPLLWKDQLTVNRIRKRPCYSPRDLVMASDQIKPVPLNQEIDVGNFAITFHDAHHILGSASLEVRERGRYTIVFSGDLGNTSDDPQKSITNIRQADVVVMESTYGDRKHGQESPDDVIQNEINIIESQKNGTLLLPAFSVDRTQTILQTIKRLKKTKKIKRITPVFLDSPMGISATKIYSDYLDESDGDGFFNFDGLVVARQSEESEAISKKSGSKVIISSSGMMDGGRVRSHAKNYLPDENSRVLFPGYLAEKTLGRQIAEGAKQVLIEGCSVSVRANIRMTESLSSHADQDGLIRWLYGLRGARKVILTHGGEVQRQALAVRIREEEELEIYDVNLPKRNEVILL